MKKRRGEEKKFKYSVLCFIVNSYEVVREVLEPDPDVDYVLVTDDKKLKSKTWRTVFDKRLLSMLPYERCAHVKYDVFRYCKTSLCVYIDASVQVKGSLDKLVNDFNASGADIALLSHPTVADMVSELQLWIKMRGYSYLRANKFLDFLCSKNYNLEYKSHFQSGLSVRRDSKMTRDMQMLVLSYLHYLSDEQEFERIDQLVLDYVINTMFCDKQVLLLSMQCLDSCALEIFKHGSSEKNWLDVRYDDLSMPEEAWCFNELKETYYLHG